MTWDTRVRRERPKSGPSFLGSAAACGPKKSTLRVCATSHPELPARFERIIGGAYRQAEVNVCVIPRIPRSSVRDYERALLRGVDLRVLRFHRAVDDPIDLGHSGPPPRLMTSH